MSKRIKIGALLPLLTVFFCLLFSIDAQGKEIQKVETEGSVQFTGIYEPIGTPEPTPPDGSEKPPLGGVNRPDGSLPKTNMIAETYLYWLGISILLFVILLWKRRKKEESTTEGKSKTKNNQKVGIIT
ncbi:LPXTG cell wall anchor domain-containing protein [Enterococcus gallinarum]|uniref:LPXTG cell wall anchor domain-containing protein n=1 Tax=Enterococcus gallinarum TaxID=1353 RepID=UPI001D17AE83|nr:LPXTG cell wall anchor domain-containing protein [Enterococcus gallinarum]MCC4044554.1 LPXTG cell wall anchor domain-containing protein [Enterococcus gallinarum]